MKLMDKSTDNLMNTLKRTSPSEVKNYMQKQFREGEPAFPGYMDALLQQKKLKVQLKLSEKNLTSTVLAKLSTTRSLSFQRTDVA